MLTVGLTGGIASGKSSVAALFAQLGAHIIDTDLIARELVEDGQPALAEITQHFGREALHADGSLIRAWLRERIFAVESERQALNAILHPRIRAAVEAQLAIPNTAPYSIVVIPLLVESAHYDELLDRVVLVDVPEATQISRLMQRDNINLTQAQAILQRQASRAQRLARADDVIDNQGAPDALPAQVNRLHADYLRLASTQLHPQTRT